MTRAQGVDPRLLGCSECQLRYAIKQGRVRADKVDGRWRFDSESLPLSPGQRQARERKAAELRERVEVALAPQIAGGAEYSVRSLGAFGAAVRLARRGERAGAEHAGARADGGGGGACAGVSSLRRWQARRVAGGAR